MTISRNGVFTAHPETAHGCMLISEKGRYPSDLPASTANRLLFSALNHNLDALWIVPGTIISHLGGAEVTSHGFVTETPECAVRAHSEDGRLTCMHLWLKDPSAPRPERRTIRVFFPEWDERWGLQNVRDPYLLLNTVDLIEGSLGIALDWSPGASGKNLLKKLNNTPARCGWLRPVDFTGTPWMPTDEELAEGVTIPSATPWAHKHWPALEDLDMTRDVFFHTYDCSYGHGGAMTTVTVGAGQPVHRSLDDVVFHRYVPGIWKLPGGKWSYTPQVEHMITGGYLLSSQLTECWIWPDDHHQTMRTFAESFWQLEEDTRGHPLARATGKRIRSQALGWLAMDVRQWRRQDGASSLAIRATDFYRPDIWYTVVAEARVKVSRTINMLQSRGYDAIWRNSDELGFLSNDPNPKTAIPIVERTGIGAFRHHYTLRFDDDLLLAFADSVEFEETHELLLGKQQQPGELYAQATQLVEAIHALHGGQSYA